MEILQDLGIVSALVLSVSFSLKSLKKTNKYDDAVTIGGLIKWKL